MILVYRLLIFVLYIVKLQQCVCALYKVKTYIVCIYYITVHYLKNFLALPFFFIFISIFFPLSLAQSLSSVPLLHPDI